MRIERMEFVGTVVPGDQRGRTIGFPTANVAPAPASVTPSRGVYAALADGLPAAVNVGVRPTFDGATAPEVIEVHVLDFQGDLYGREMHVTLLERVRGEQQFDGPAALADQLEHDVQQVREIIRTLGSSVRTSGEATGS